MFINKFSNVFPSIVFHIQTEWRVEATYNALSLFNALLGCGIAAAVAYVVIVRLIVGI